MRGPTNIVRLTCPDCGADMELIPNRKGRLFYRCTRYPDCRGCHGAHPDGRPLGQPGDYATRQARVRLHEITASLWQSGAMTRRQVDQLLADILGVDQKDAHIGSFSGEQCEQVLNGLKQRGLLLS